MLVLAECGRCYRKGVRIVLRDKKCPVHGDARG